MPQIFDNVELKLGDDLKKVFAQAESMDSVVGYFNAAGLLNNSLTVPEAFFV
jgi:hypothetical protein